MKIADALDPIWGSDVIACTFDALNGLLSLHVQNENSEQHQIVVSGISFSLFLQEDGDVFNAEIKKYYLEDVIIRTTKIKTHGDKWLKQFDLRYNLAIDLFYSTLLLCAQSICIDGIKFEIL